MYLPQGVLRQFVIFVAVSAISVSIMAFHYLKIPSLWFGAGHYEVTAELPESAGLYDRANVTYHGVKVGIVKSVRLTDSGVAAVLFLESGTSIPADLSAEVHSQSAVGEQYIALTPRTSSGRSLRNGDVISRDRTSTPPDINGLLDATNRGLLAIPQENLKTVVNESYTAVGGLGPDLRRLVEGASKLAIDGQNTLEPLTSLIDRSAPVLDSQADSSDAIRAWAAHLADITDQLKRHDAALRGVLQKTVPAADQVKQLLDRLNPTLPVILANLVSVGQVALTYHDGLEQLLVLLPQGAATVQAIGVPNRNTKQGFRGAFLSFNLNLNLPPPCTTGFLPAQQQRTAANVDVPDRPAGDLYCRTPQDAMFNVRGARNIPCPTRPGKRAPTWQMCESDENYMPLNDGYNWKGDPNATLSGQGVPQLPAAAPLPKTASPPPPPAGPVGPSSTTGPSPPQSIDAAEYDTATGTYLGPDGQTYTQTELSRTATKDKSWQAMLMPPNG
jgi:phospholipid/cholesterol/gamma-HCH transport system substrate-binding protein